MSTISRYPGVVTVANPIESGNSSYPMAEARVIENHGKTPLDVDRKDSQSSSTDSPTNSDTSSDTAVTCCCLPFFCFLRNRTDSKEAPAPTAPSLSSSQSSQAVGDVAGRYLNSSHTDQFEPIRGLILEQPNSNSVVNAFKTLSTKGLTDAERKELIGLCGAQYIAQNQNAAIIEIAEKILPQVKGKSPLTVAAMHGYADGVGLLLQSRNTHPEDIKITLGEMESKKKPSAASKETINFLLFHLFGLFLDYQDFESAHAFLSKRPDFASELLPENKQSLLDRCLEKFTETNNKRYGFIIRRLIDSQGCGANALRIAAQDGYEQVLRFLLQNIKTEQDLKPVREYLSSFHLTPAIQRILEVSIKKVEMKKALSSLLILTTNNGDQTSSKIKKELKNLIRDLIDYPEARIALLKKYENIKRALGLPTAPTLPSDTTPKNTFQALPFPKEKTSESTCYKVFQCKLLQRKPLPTVICEKEHPKYVSYKPIKLIEAINKDDVDGALSLIRTDREARIETSDIVRTIKEALKYCPNAPGSVSAELRNKANSLELGVLLTSLNSVLREDHQKISVLMDQIESLILSNQESDDDVAETALSYYNNIIHVKNNIVTEEMKGYIKRGQNQYIPHYTATIGYYNNAIERLCRLLPEFTIQKLESGTLQFLYCKEIVDTLKPYLEGSS